MSSIRTLFSYSMFRAPRKSSALIIKTAITLTALALLGLFPATAQAQHMKLLTPTTGWVSNNGHLYWTTDSGSHWADITPIPANAHVRGVGLLSVYFLDTQQGWAIISYPETVVPVTPQALRTRGTIYDLAQTVDGGQTWSFLPLSYPPLPKWEQDAQGPPGDMFFLDSLHGWLVMTMVGSSNFAPGKLLATDDGGRNWKWENGPGTIGTLLFTSTQDGWLAGGPGGLRLFATHDGCKTWERIDLTPPPGLHTSPQAVYEGTPQFTGPQDAYVAARFEGVGGAPSRLIVFATADAGSTWRPSKILQDSWEGGMLPVALADSVLVVPSGSSMKAIRVASAHLSGKLSSSVVVSGKGTYGLTFADARHGLAITESGLLYTSDSGATWKNVTPWHIFKPKPSKIVPNIGHPKLQMEVNKPNASLSLAPQSSGGGGGTHTSIHVGFDKACAPKPAYMQSWWTYSPYYDIGIYLGGVNVSCKNNANLTSGWVGTVTGTAHGSTQGWGLIPIWVGLQSPCYFVDPNHPQNFAVFGKDPNTPPYQQGYDEAVGANGNPGAGSIASGLGLSGTIIYYDMENYDTTDTTCAAEVESFVSGWVAGIHSLGYLAGVYANPAPVQADMSLASPQPDDIWITHWDNRATVFDPEVDNSLWPEGKRIRQYYLNSSETYGGVSLGGAIDRDIEDAEVAGANGAKSYSYSTFHDIADGSELITMGGMNNAYQGQSPVKFGQTAGWESNPSTYADSGFWWDNGPLNPLGFTTAYGLNSSSSPTNPSEFQVVGEYGVAGTTTGYGYLFDVETGSYSSYQYPGAQGTWMDGVSDDVQIAGYYGNLQNGSWIFHGFVDNAGTLSPLNITSAITSTAYGINGMGQIVGSYETSDGNVHGFVYQNGALQATIGCGGAAKTYFYGINNNEQIIGTCFAHGTYTGFVYDYSLGKIVTTFSDQSGNHATFATGINDNAQITGYWWNQSIAEGFYAAADP